MSKRKKPVAPSKVGVPHEPRLFHDYGGDGTTRGYKGTQKWQCNDCGHYQVVPFKASQRRTRPACASCGGDLIPSKRAQSRFPALRCYALDNPVQRRCTNCSAILRQGNKEDICAPCRRNPDWIHNR